MRVTDFKSVQERTAKAIICEKLPSKLNSATDRVTANRKFNLMTNSSNTNQSSATQPPVQSAGIEDFGVNLVGEIDSTAQGTGYNSTLANTEEEISYFAANGDNTIRLPISWEKIQPTLNGPLDPYYIS